MKKLFRKVCDFFADPHMVLGLSVAIGLVSIVQLLCADPVYYRDSAYYVSMTQAFALGDWGRAFPLWLPSLLQIPAGIICFLGVPPMGALVIVSSVFTILTIFPLYGLLCFFMERKYAGWGALMFILAPKIIRFGFAPLVDGGRWFFLALALFLMFRYVYKGRKTTDLIYLGIAYAGMTLIRAEGIVFVFFMSCFLMLMLWEENRWKLKWKTLGKWILGALLPLGILLVLISPRLVQTYCETGYPACDMRQAVALRSIFDASDGEGAQSGAIDGERYSDPEFQSRFWENFWVGGNEPYVGLSFIAIVVLLCLKKWNFRYTIMLLWLFVNMGAFLAMQAAAGRYFYVNVIFLMPFAVFGLDCLMWPFRYAEKRFNAWYIMILPAIVLVVVAFLQYKGGIDNVFIEKKVAYIKEMGALVRKLQAEETGRSGTERFTVLSLGRNYGWGYYCDANMMMHGDYYTGLTDLDPVAVARDGVDVSYVLYPAEKLPAAGKVLLPDMVLIADPDENGEAIAGFMKLPEARLIAGGPEERFVAFRIYSNKGE